MNLTHQSLLSNTMRILTTTFISGILTLVLSLPVFAAIEAVEFDNPETKDRYQDIIAELRCLVCQNQNLADSDAELAKDLRGKAAQMIKSGASDEEILSYMQERYGDFVLYRPPFNSATALLWVGPFVLLFFAACFLIILIRRRQNDELSKPLSQQDEAQREKVRNLIKNAPQLNADQTDPDQKGHD
jgi:cytochrome c-type biogenesis protein CcmH